MEPEVRAPEAKFANSTCFHTNTKLGNLAKLNQLKNSSLTDTTPMFKDNIITFSTFPHPLIFNMLFQESPPSPQWLSRHLQTLARNNFPSNASDSNSNKHLLLKVWTPADLINLFLVISRLINYTPLKYHAKFYNM